MSQKFYKNMGWLPIEPGKKQHFVVGERTLCNRLRPDGVLLEQTANPNFICAHCHMTLMRRKITLGERLKNKGR